MLFLCAYIFVQINCCTYSGFGTELDTWLKKSCRKIWSIVHVPQILHTSFSILLWSADNGAKTFMKSHFNFESDFVCSQTWPAIMPYPCSGQNLISNLVTDYIQKRRGEPGLFSFEYNLLQKMISNFYHYMDKILICNFSEMLLLSKFLLCPKKNSVKGATAYNIFTNAVSI